jgi:hypothetical protein
MNLGLSIDVFKYIRNVVQGQAQDDFATGVGILRLIRSVDNIQCDVEILHKLLDKSLRVLII